MNRETEAQDLPSCPVAAKLWYNKTSYWPSSNSKGQYIPMEKAQSEKQSPKTNKQTGRDGKNFWTL